MSESFFINVLPKQTTPIPWGWENTTIDDGTFLATYVSKPLGKISMPNLVEYFDWKTFILEGRPRDAVLGTRNMKSVFTTAARFLGYEELLATRPSLHEITLSFLNWNQLLLSACAHLSRPFYYLLGDDIAGNTGLMVSPCVLREWLLPEYTLLVAQAHEYGARVVFHSDGDLSRVLSDLAELDIDELSYEPVGGMASIEPYSRCNGVLYRPVQDQLQRHENSMALQRGKI